jgi:DNA-binding NarL/FixJ family response regulator
VLRAAGRAGEAEPHTVAAREVADRLGAEPLVRELKGVSGARASSSADRHSRRAPARRAASEQQDGQLTPREQEVLGLVAQGRTNGEIGRQLFISTKTVSVHVSNILAKVGAASRTEAVAVARSRRLLHDELDGIRPAAEARQP